jgi:uncharacterized peroxidase-related enzyme
VGRFKRGWRQAGLRPADAALMAYAEKLTRTPWSMTRADVEALKREGLTDDQISDAVQVIAYFAYINRIADGLGVDLEHDMAPPPEEA